MTVNTAAITSCDSGKPSKWRLLTRSYSILTEAEILLPVQRPSTAWAARGSNSGRGNRFPLHKKPSRPVLKPKKSPIQWVTGFFPWGNIAAPTPADVKSERRSISSPLIRLHGVKSGNFTCTAFYLCNPSSLQFFSRFRENSFNTIKFQRHQLSSNTVGNYNVK
jgi:hypothetical protein